MIFGVGCYLLAGELTPYGSVGTEWIAFSPLALLGSIAPDIDNTNATFKSNIIVKILSWPLTLLGHRTWSHSLLLLAALWFLSLNAPTALQMPLFAFFIGVGSHIIGDLLTPHGCQLFFPIPGKYSIPIVFKTGSPIEYPVAFLPTLYYLYLIGGGDILKSLISA